MIKETLREGEEIHAMHRRTTWGADGERLDHTTHARLQSIHVGEVILRTLQFIRNVRRSGSCSDRFAKNALDRVLKLSCSLQKTQTNLTTFWSHIVSIVADLQNMLSKHHLELGIEELATNISDVENRMALTNITQ